MAEAPPLRDESPFNYAGVAVTGRQLLDPEVEAVSQDALDRLKKQLQEMEGKDGE